MLNYKRIFFAINLPEEIKEKLESEGKEINKLFLKTSQGISPIRWVEKKNLHITLLFIGRTEKSKLKDIFEVADKISAKYSKFSLKLLNICYGPKSYTPPRLIWAEIENNKILAELAREIKDEISKNNISQKNSENDFKPHITIGRIKAWQWRAIEPEERPKINKEITLEFPVKSIDVMESKLKRSGAEYNKLASFSLK